MSRKAKRLRRKLETVREDNRKNYDRGAELRERLMEEQRETRRLSAELSRWRPRIDIRREYREPEMVSVGYYLDSRVLMLAQDPNVVLEMTAEGIVRELRKFFKLR